MGSPLPRGKCPLDGETRAVTHHGATRVRPHHRADEPPASYPSPYPSLRAHFILEPDGSV